MRYLNIQDILNQESGVEKETQYKLKGFYDKAMEGINLLISLQYLMPMRKDDLTDEDRYFSYVHSWFYMSIFTFRSCVLLLSRGYYFEASLLNRNLVEVLVKMRYFLNHKEKLKEFENIEALQTGKPKMNFRLMFDEVFPGFYEKYRLESHVAHGGIGARLMKIKYHSATHAEVDQGVVYNEWRAGSIVNSFGVYFLGYIRLYKKLYPQIIISLPPEASTEFFSIEAWFIKMIQDHIKLKGGENDWHRAIKSIWDF